MPANQAPRFICRTALSFGHRGLSIAPRYRSSPVGARLAGEPDTAVYLLHRVIVLRL